MLSAHYRSPVNYSEQSIINAKTSLNRIYTCKNNLALALAGALPGEDACTVDFSKYKADFLAAMDDDLNTADAIGVLFSLVREVNSLVASHAAVKILQCAADLLDELCDLLGICKTEDVQAAGQNSGKAAEIRLLLEQRKAAKAAKDFAVADVIRDKIKGMDYTLEDTKDGQKVTYEENGQQKVFLLP